MQRPENALVISHIYTVKAKKRSGNLFIVEIDKYSNSELLMRFVGSLIFNLMYQLSCLVWYTLVIRNGLAMCQFSIGWDRNGQQLVFGGE